MFCRRAHDQCGAVVNRCPVCNNDRWIYAADGDGEPVKEACPACRVVPPSEEDMQCMYQQRTRRMGETNAA